MQALLPFLLALSLHTACARMLTPPPSGVDGDKQPETRLIAIGGRTERPLSSVEILSLADNSHTDGASAPAARAEFATVQVNNTVYIMAGTDGLDFYSDFWEYDIAANKWTTSATDLPNVPVKTQTSNAVYINEQIIFLGGFAEGNIDNDQVFTFDSKLRRWNEVKTEIPADDSPCSVVQGAPNALWYAASIDMFLSLDGAQSWMTAPDRSHFDRDDASCVAVGTDGILKIGGATYGTAPMDTVEMFNTTTLKWTKLASMSMARKQSSAVRLPDTNQVVVCGGLNSKEKAVASCEIYDWVKNVWTAAPFSLSVPRAAFGLYVTQV